MNKGDKTLMLVSIWGYFISYLISSAFFSFVIPFEEGKFLLYPTLNHGLGGEEQEEMARAVIQFLTEA